MILYIMYVLTMVWSIMGLAIAGAFLEEIINAPFKKAFIICILLGPMVWVIALTGHILLPLRHFIDNCVDSTTNWLKEPSKPKANSNARKKQDENPII